VPHLFLDDDEYAVVEAACERLIPGATEAGVADYVDGLLGAFVVDPPRIWAGGPFSGRHGGDAGFGTFIQLTRLDELAWRTRIEGSRGIPEREFNGPVVGLQERYRDGIDGLGPDFATANPDAQAARLDADSDFTALLYEHACEGMYGAPEYGGNRDQVGWKYIKFPGDAQPRGYTAEQMLAPDTSAPISASDLKGFDVQELFAHLALGTARDAKTPWRGRRGL